MSDALFFASIVYGLGVLVTVIIGSMRRADANLCYDEADIIEEARAGARMILLSWAWPVMFLVWFGKYVGALALDATRKEI